MPAVSALGLVRCLPTSQRTRPERVMPCALADMSRAGIHSAGSLTWNWAIWPVAGDPVEVKRSPIG